MKSKKNLYVQVTDVVALPTYLLKYLATSMEQSPSWEINSSSHQLKAVAYEIMDKITNQTIFLIL